MSPENLNQINQAHLAPTYTAFLRLFGPGLLAFSLTAIVMPFYIAWLKKFHIDQQLREEGPKSHAHKAKTPTMGGLCFMLATMIGCALMFFFPVEKSSLFGCFVVLAVAFLCGMVGFLDDAAKVRQKANKGISAKLRLLSETILGVVLGLVLALSGTVNLVLPYGLAHALGLIPPDLVSTIAAGQPHSAFWLLPIPLLAAVALGAFLTAATTNAVNLHDGMDGLAAGTATLVFVTMAFMFICLNELGYATISATAALALLAFLIYNKNPAKIFMGDTGSLFIGGLIATLVTAGGLTLYFVPLSLIYIAEALSVMAQVTYFKLTKPYTPEKPMSPPALALFKLTRRLPGEGKRLFRMAPLHHHFEAVLTPRGWAEAEVVAAFWVVQFMLCLATLGLFLGLK